MIFILCERDRIVLCVLCLSMSMHVCVHVCTHKPYAFLGDQGYTYTLLYYLNYCMPYTLLCR